MTSHGVEREETGRVEEYKGNAILRIIGSYSYIDSSGIPYKIFYQADEDGSKFEDHLGTTRHPPTPPPPESPISSGAIASLAGGGIYKWGNFEFVYIPNKIFNIIEIISVS